MSVLLYLLEFRVHRGRVVSNLDDGHISLRGRINTHTIARCVDRIPVRTSAARIEIILRPDASGGCYNSQDGHRVVAVAIKG